MINKWLREEHRFLGRIIISKGWCPAVVQLQPDIELHIFLPGLYDINNDIEIPRLIEGRLEEWDIRISDGAISVSYQHHDFDSLNEKLLFNEKEKNIFHKNCYKQIWTEITFLPKTCTFARNGSSTNIPDEWGISFYPERNNSILFHLFSNNRNPPNLPNLFNTVDNSLYFSNDEQWTIISIQKRLKLLTSCLSFFAGAPISYEVLVGRCKKEVLFVQIKNESNPNAYICPSRYNCRIDIKGNSMSTFSSELIKKVEVLYNTSNIDKLMVLLNYFKNLHMAFYDDVKIAFSFQLMESLAKYKGIRFGKTYKNELIKKVLRKLSKEMCSTCNGLLEKEIKTEEDDFRKYIEKALDVLKTDNQLKINPDMIKKIARKYRNEIFHGNFFDSMTKIDNLINTLPQGYRDDLPVVLQAIVSIIGVNVILGIDFNQMIALKRKMHYVSL